MAHFLLLLCHYGCTCEIAINWFYISTEPHHIKNHDYQHIYISIYTATYPNAYWIKFAQICDATGASKLFVFSNTVVHTTPKTNVYVSCSASTCVISKCGTMLNPTCAVMKIKPDSSDT